MNQQKIGKFIALCRKEKNLTQEQLANKLGVTDKSVSKWERERGLPDVSLFEKICEILEITLNELFAGEYISGDNIKKITDYNLRVFIKFNQIKKEKILLYLNFFCLISIFICTLIDFILMNRLTWSLIVNGSIVFVYICLYILLEVEQNKFLKTLLAFNMLIFPFLFLIEKVVNDNYLTVPSNWFLPIAIPIVLMWSIFIWFLFLIKKYTKINIWNWFGILFFLTIFLNIGMSMTLMESGSFKLVEYQWFNNDNIINISSSILCSLGCFYIGIFKKSK